MTDHTLPEVSIVMANFNGAAYIGDAIESALAQTLGSIEVIVADDASTDCSCATVQAIAARDARVRLLPSVINAGPGAARNRAMAASRGRWIAVLDSDDLMEPRRLEILLGVATTTAAEIVADDLAYIDEAATLSGASLSAGQWPCVPYFTVSAQAFVESNRLYGRQPALGYLKPLFRRRTIEELGVRYSESMRIGEDYDFALRLLVQGARLVVHPQALYRYRRRVTSISHRLTSAAVNAMRLGDEAFRRDLPGLDSSLLRSLDARMRSLDDALAYERTIEALKQHKPLQALRIALAQPGCIPLLRMPLLARWRRARGPAGEAAGAADAGSSIRQS